VSVRVEHGDCLAVLPALLAEGVLVDSVVCDPPYHLTSIVKRFGGDNAAPAMVGATGAYARASKGFMGKQWDGGDIAFRPETWAAVMAVMKPGAHLIAFGGSRTFHRMAVAIEDAGFEIRDTLFYCYGSGFPKSHNINKALAKEVCQCRADALRERDLRSVRNAGLSASKHPEDQRCEILLDGLSQQDTSEYWSARAEPEATGGKQPRMEGWGDAQATKGQLHGRPLCASASVDSADGAEGRLHHGASACDGADVRVSADAHRGREPQGSQPGEQSPEQPRIISDECGSQARGGWPVCGRCCKPIIPEGLGSALKPAHEPIVLARKPLAKGHTIAANVLAHGVGGLNIDACRIAGEKTAAPVGVFRGSDIGASGLRGERNGSQDALGRWPANLIHDGSDEVIAAFPSERPGGRPVTGRGDSAPIWGNAGHQDFAGYADSGSAARFFYSAKADAADRCSSKHPTVKPTDLMAYLCRLVTPPGGLVLDPFAGSGSTGMACLREGFDAILIEREAEYVADIRRRIAHVSGLDSPLFGQVA